MLPFFTFTDPKGIRTRPRKESIVAMNDPVQHLAREFPVILAEVLKDNLTPLDALPASAELEVHFAISGDLKGTLAVGFASPREAARRFLEITIGDPDGADISEACQEIANQAVGRILGAVGERGLSVEISYPGKVIPDGIVSGRFLCGVQSDLCGTMGLALLGESAEQLAAALAPAPAAGQETASTRVLIVDDSPVMCAFLEKIFTEHGYTVVGKAADGEEALEMFQRFDPDLVTLDIIMPKLKGTEVLQRILNMRPDAKVVMATSVSDARTVMNCLKLGAKRYIIKPYDKQAVIGAVEKALGLGGRGI